MIKNKIILVMIFLLATMHILIFSMQGDSKKIAYLCPTNKNEILITKPSYVKFLPNNRVFINGNEGFILYDCSNHTSLLEKRRSDDNISIAVNGAKTKIAVSADFTIT